MALAKKTATSTTSTAQVNTWDQQMADEAAIAMQQESNVLIGNKISFKSGILAFEGVPMPGNEMAVVILDGILEIMKGSIPIVVERRMQAYLAKD